MGCVRLTWILVLILPRALALAGGPATRSAVREVGVNEAGLKVTAVRIPATATEYELVRVPDGVVKAGNGEVAVKGIWVAKTEITWDCFDAWSCGLDAEHRLPDAESRPTGEYGPPDRGWGHQGYPAIGYTRFAAEAYCRWLSAKTGRRFRLPTEAEWIYACQAGKVVPDGKEVERYAWCRLNSDGKTHPVGQKAPNAWGLYDMLGNAGEWVTADGSELLKGGSFKDPAEALVPGFRDERKANWTARDPTEPKNAWFLSDGPFAGFRIVMEE